MAFDDPVLRLQSFVGRVSRWARLPRPAEEAGCPRRFLIVQIDGLSRSVLERALATGRMRGLARLLSARRLEMRPLSVGIPSSTPAFQAALMYGVHPDIPGFHWYDKRERAEHYFPRPGIADLVEERLARGRRGIMEGGACYGCVFTGGATDGLAGPPDASDTIRVVAAGRNAFVYFTEAPEPLPVEEIEARYPGGAAALSEHPGIGFVLARSAAGPVCWSRGRRTVLDEDARGTPFEGRADRDVVLMGLRQLTAMPSAGDLVLYGIGAPAGDVSFVDEIGAHAGPAEAELQTFILHPPAVALPAGPLTHPIQLYPHFAAYAGPVRDPVGAARRLESAPAIAGAP